MNFTSLKAIFDAVPSPCLILLPDFPRFTIVNANRAYCLATNTPACDLVNKGLFEAFPDNPNDPETNGEEKVRASLELVIATKISHKLDVQKYDIPVRNSEDFEVRYWSPENSPVLNDLGEIDYIIHNVTDITEKIKAEEERESEKRNKEALINNTDDLIWSVSRDFKLVAANNAFIQNLKTSTGITLKPGDDLMMSTIFPDDFLEFWKNVYRKALLSETFKEEIFTPATGNSVDNWAEISFNPIYEDDGVIGIACFSRNITERKFADEQLKKSEARLAAAQSVAKVGSWETDLLSLSVIWSEETYRIFEIPPESYTSHPNFLEFVHPEDKEKVDAAFVDSLGNKSVNSIEHRIITPNGLIKSVEERWQIFRDDRGQAIRAVGTCQDISELKKIETEKKRSEKAIEIERQRFQDLYSQAPSSMGILKGPNHVYELANPLYLQLIDKKDIIGKTVKEVLPELETQGIFELLDTVYTTGQTFSANEMLFKFDLQGTGELSDSYLNLIYQAHRNPEGAIDGIFFFVVDVTEQVISRKKIEENQEHYRSLFDHHPDAVFSFDLEGNFLSANPGAAKLAECSIEELLGITFLPLIPPEDLARVLEYFIKASTGEIQNYNTGLTTVKGNHLMINVTNLPIIINKEIIGVYGIAKDITEIKAAEQHLKLLESVITNTNDAVMITEAEPFDEPGPRILYVNEAFTKMTGYSEEEVIGKSPRILQGPKSDKDELKRLSESMRKCEPCEITTVNYKKNGEEFWINFSISPVANEKGRFTHWISIERDVTESKKIEQKIINERALLRTLIDNLPHTIYFKDESARKLISNKVDYELLGAAIEEEVLHKTDLEVLQNELTISGYHLDIEVLTSGRSIIDFEQYFIREDGSTSCFLTTKIPLRNEQDEIIGLLGIGRDITEKKHQQTALRLNEQRFKALVHEGSDLISILDENRHYTYVSPAYTSILGIKYEELIGTKSLDRVHEDDLERISQTSARLTTEKRVHFLPFRYRVDKGKYRWLECIGTNLMDDPSVKGFLFNSKDVTERMNYIQAIEEQNTNLREIAWIQSHLVRAPVCRILGLVELIKNYQDRINEPELLNHIYDSAQELDVLIKDIVARTQKIDF